MTEISKKQYVLSSCQWDLPCMQCRKVGEFYLYTDEKLNVWQGQTASGDEVVLLGHAFCTDGEKMVVEDIRTFSGDDFVALTSFWTGRWVLISKTTLVTDATGLMGAYYGQKDGRWLVSSSPALVATLLGAECKPTVKASGLSWHLLPSSVADGVKKLFCSETLKLSSDRLTPFFSNRFSDLRNLTTEEKCRRVADMLVNAAVNIHQYSGKRITLALTGGKDSRLVLSALCKAGVPFDACTAAHRAISRSDREMPPKLAARFGINHRYLGAKPMDEERLADYYRFCGGNHNGVDAFFYASGQFDELDEDVILLRSGLFEAGQTYARGYTSSDPEGFQKGMTAYYADLQKSETRDTLAFWLYTVRQNPIEHLDIRDRFYVEQRVGGWVAAIEQSLDIHDFTSIQIANCAALLSVLLSCNEQERGSLALSYQTISLLEPAVLDFAVNKPSPSDRLRRLLSALKQRLRGK